MKERERKRKEKIKEENVQPERDNLDDARGGNRAQRGGRRRIYILAEESNYSIRQTSNSPAPALSPALMPDTV